MTLQVDPNEDFETPQVEQKAPETKPEPEPQAKTAPATLRPTPIAIRAGQAAPQTIEDQFRMATLYLKSGMLPARFTKPEAVLTAMHFAAEHFPDAPLTALRQIAVIEGTPAMFGDLPLAKVQNHPAYAGKREYFLDEHSKIISVENQNLNAPVWAAVCTTFRKMHDGSKESHTTTFTVEDAKRAGLWNKKTKSGNDTPWVKYPADMMKYRARGRNLKDHFADALNGVGIGEFDHGITIDEAKSGPTVAERLNNAYLETKTDRGSGPAGAGEAITVHGVHVESES